MSDNSLLRMPEHTVHVPNADGRDFWHNEKGTICRASRIPGYAMMMEDPGHFGHLRCTRCGWVTPEQVVLTYSPQTDRHYLTWEDLMSAEANGWVVIGTSTRPNTRPVVVGPYDTQAEANKARTRLRGRWVREENALHGHNRHGFKISTVVRVLWKEERDG